MKTNCSHCRHFSQLSRTATALWLACALAVFGMSLHVLADTVGVPWTGAPGITETVADIMARDWAMAIQGTGQVHTKPMFRANRSGLPQNPDSPATTEMTTHTATARNRGPFGAGVAGGGIIAGGKTSDRGTGATAGDAGAGAGTSGHARGGGDVADAVGGIEVGHGTAGDEL